MQNRVLSKLSKTSKMNNHGPRSRPRRMSMPTTSSNQMWTLGGGRSRARTSILQKGAGSHRLRRVVWLKTQAGMERAKCIATCAGHTSMRQRALVSAEMLGLPMNTRGLGLFTVGLELLGMDPVTGVSGSTGNRRWVL